MEEQLKTLIEGMQKTVLGKLAELDDKIDEVSEQTEKKKKRNPALAEKEFLEELEAVADDPAKLREKIADKKKILDLAIVYGWKIVYRMAKNLKCTVEELPGKMAEDQNIAMQLNMLKTFEISGQMVYDSPAYKKKTGKAPKDKGSGAKQFFAEPKKEKRK